MEFQIENGVLLKYDGNPNVKEAAVPEGVTAIGSAVFANLKNLTSVKLPDGLTEIGDSAFYMCSSLRIINIPDSVVSIADSAFYECRKLSRVVLPEGITIIEDSVFSYCESLSEIHIPDGVKSIGNFAFKGCKRLSEISIPDGVTSICDQAFSGCSSLVSITIPESVNRIGDFAFFKCRKLREITIEGEPVFHGFLLGENNSVFSMCESLERFIASCSIDVIFGDSLPAKLDIRKLLPLFTEKALKTYVIPVFQTADTSLAAETFLTRHSENMTEYYSAFRGNKINDLGKEIIRILSSAELSEELCNSAADYILLYYNSAEAGILRSVYEIIRSDKFGANALELLKHDPVAMKAVDSSETVKPDMTSAEMKILSVYTRQDLKRILKDSYSLLPAELPLIKYKTGKTAAPEVLAYLLIVNNKYMEPGICSEAEEVVNEIDAESLQSALLSLADSYFRKRASGRKIMLAFPFCRYADEDTFRAVSRNSKKWHTESSGADAPLVREFLRAAVYNTSREAAVFADDYHDTESYARVRNISADTIRDTILADTGLDNRGMKEFVLGSMTVTVCLQNDFSLLFALPDGRTVKALPKKYAGEEFYESVKKESDELKKKCSKAAQMRYDYLFECFLDGHERNAAEWKEAYFNNPLLKKTAMSIVWSQGENTFVMTESGLVRSNGEVYDLGVTPVKVAHPVEMNCDDIEVWKNYFKSHDLKQPFIQIDEPVYDPNTIQVDRYQGRMIEYGHFLDQEKRGIHIIDEDYHDIIRINIDEVNAYIKRIDWASHYIDPSARFEVREFRFYEFTRRVNHIIAYLDKIIYRKTAIMFDFL